MHLVDRSVGDHHPRGHARQVTELSETVRWIRLRALRRDAVRMACRLGVLRWAFTSSVYLHWVWNGESERGFLEGAFLGGRGLWSFYLLTEERDF